MSAANKAEGKREEFRKYLEKTGVMDTLTKVLVSLYEESEKPDDALGFIRDRLATQAGLETYAQLTKKIEDLQARIAELGGGGPAPEPPAEEPPVEPPAEEPPAAEPPAEEPPAEEPPAEEAPAEAPPAEAE